MMKDLKVMQLPVPADLAPSSFQEAKDLLGDDLPILLVCTKDQLGDFGDWLWDHSRVTSICLVPKEILVNKDAWSLQGHCNAVVSLGP